MKLSVLILISLALVLPVQASILTFDMTGVLGPLESGTDPLSLAGDSFEFTGTIDQNAVPVSTDVGSATYDVSGDVQLIMRGLTFTSQDASLTIMDSDGGPDYLLFTFQLSAYGFTPEIAASLSLPAGTFTGAAPQDFGAATVGSDSSVSYFLIDNSTFLSGSYGLSGTASMTGGAMPGSGVPEPGSIALMAGGLAAVVWKVRGRRKSRAN
jgi:PEP-CTERM motif